jgi:hypothetical protein
MMMRVLEAIGVHPWAAIGVGTWLLIIIGMVVSALKECVAILVTGKRAPQPDWRSLARAQATMNKPKHETES